MIIDREKQLKIPVNFSRDLEMVHDFVYLGSTIADSGGCEAEIGKRLVWPSVRCQVSIQSGETEA